MPDKSGAKSDDDAHTTENSSSTESTPDASAAPENEKPSDDKQQAFGTRYLSILVVEDEISSRMVLTKILTIQGHICEAAKNGYEGLALIRRSLATRRPFDLIITDIMMPEMDGWSFINALAERGAFPQIPVAVITAMATLDAVRKCRELGIHHFIVKPFAAAKIHEVVQAAVAITHTVDGRSV